MRAMLIAWVHWGLGLIACAAGWATVPGPASGTMPPMTADDQLLTAVESIRTALYEDNRELIRGDRTVRTYQLRALKGVELIARYRRGDAAALDTLFSEQSSLHEVVSSTTNPTPKDLAAIEQRLIFLMQTLHDLRLQLTPDLELYWKQQKELDELTKTYKAALRKAQVTAIAWARAHQRLASGVTDPAKIDVLGLAKKAAGTASPL